MKKITYSFKGLICILSFVLLCNIDIQSQSLKVMTYNIKNFESSEIQKIADVIIDNNPDIVSILEIERYKPNSGVGNVAKKLADASNMKYYLFIHSDKLDNDGEKGNLILSKIPITDYRTYKLGKTEDKDVIDCFGYISLEQDGKNFHFASAKLNDKESENTRINQIIEIASFIENLNGPIILGGDLSAYPGSTTLTELEKYFSASGSSNAGDIIMHTPENAFSVSNCDVIKNPDNNTGHLPIIATFSFK